MKYALITGANGFLGSHVARYLKKKNYVTFGVSNRATNLKKLKKIGINNWKTSEVNIKSILKFNQKFDLIVDCSGSGLVSYSNENPYLSFKKTVNSTLEILEYIRLYNPKAHLIYPSSPAVIGENIKGSINEKLNKNPISIYGFHKKIVEELSYEYSRKYNIRVSIIRFFSIFGNGLKKQLLWDAYNKIKRAKKVAKFLGTGKETRDLIHISDALNIIDIVLKSKDKFLIINGGTGKKYSIKKIVYKIRDLVKPNIKIIFNNKVNEGNPINFCANMKKLKEYGFIPQAKIAIEIKNYINWASKLND